MGLDWAMEKCADKRRGDVGKEEESKQRKGRKQNIQM